MANDNDKDQVITAIVQPTPDEVAQILRWCDMRLQGAVTSLVAFGDARFIDAISSEAARLDDMRGLVKQMLDRLPPEPPMAPEREAAAARVIGAVLDKRFGDGGDEPIREAIDDMLDSGSTETGT